MYCQNCGEKIPEGSFECPKCAKLSTASYAYIASDEHGAYSNTGSMYLQERPREKPVQVYPGMPTPSSVLTKGILAVAFACTFPVTFLGIMFGAKALSSSTRLMNIHGYMPGQGKAGRILGRVGLILGIVMTAYVIFFFLIMTGLFAEVLDELDTGGHIYFNY